MSSEGAIVEAVDNIVIGNLSLGSGSQLAVQRGAINVTHEIALSPHFLTRCAGETSFRQAGSCAWDDKCSAATCGWSGAPVCQCNPGTPNATNKDCYIRKKLCSSGAPVPDLNAEWLLNYAKERCFVDATGLNLFSPKFNASRPCVPMNVRRPDLSVPRMARAITATVGRVS